MLLTLLSLSVFVGPLLACQPPEICEDATGLVLPSTSVDIPSVCQEIASSVSSASGVFFPGTEQYTDDISHYAASSSQESVCSFEPGTPKDVGIALQILGRTRYPFAVKSGGHAMNLGFSSTPGVQIALSRFSNVTYDSATQTAQVGGGLVWDDVYAALEPYGVNVAGGRVSGIGVGGFTLGGGYSWHANEYGLALDLVEAFELVLPNGNITKVNASEADLFFALKGGFNNFGIVTQFTLKTFPQTQVWGGTVFYNESQIDQLTKAISEFAANNTDPKANILASYSYLAGSTSKGVNGSVILYYDAPSPPAGLFDKFLATYSSANISTQSFLSLVQAASGDSSEVSALRSIYNTVSVPCYPVDFLQYMAEQMVYWGSTLPLGFGYVSVTAEPFLPSMYSHNTTASAWPGSRAFFTPINISYGWTGNGSTDDVIINGLKQTARNLRANASVPEHLSLYTNYAIGSTPLEAMYGRNVERLRRIAKEVDPGNVMGLAGGFKF